ncbi:MAG: hypothetical protein R3F65_04035 [bacterium]
MPAPRALIALLLLTAACVDVPRRPFAPGAAPLDADPGADAMPFDAAPDADAPLDAEAPDAPLDADADADTPDQGAPDQDPPDPGPATCPAPCAVPGTLAAYLPLERVDAITRLPDDSVMLGGAAPAADLVTYAATLDRPLAAVVHGAIPADGVHPHLPFLLRLTPDLAAVTALHVFNTPGAPLSRLAARVGSDGATRLYASSQRGAEAIVDDVIDPIAGYHLIELDPNAPAGITQTGLSAVAAEGDLQTTPIWAPRADRYVVHVTGLALGPGWSAAQLAIPGVAPTAFNGWRHHVSLVPSPEPVRLGVLPPGEWYSVLPFAGALYCPHRSWTVADFQRLAPDGNGGLQRGAWPFDPYGSGHCGRGATLDTRTLPPADYGAHGWFIDPTVSAEPTDAVVDPGTGEFYLAFNARARRSDAPPSTPPPRPGPSTSCPPSPATPATAASSGGAGPTPSSSTASPSPHLPPSASSRSRSTPARPARSSCSPRPPSAARTLWPAPTTAPPASNAPRPPCPSSPNNPPSAGSAASPSTAPSSPPPTSSTPPRRPCPPPPRSPHAAGPTPTPPPPRAHHPPALPPVPRHRPPRRDQRPAPASPARSPPPTPGSLRPHRRRHPVGTGAHPRLRRRPLHRALQHRRRSHHRRSHARPHHHRRRHHLRHRRPPPRRRPPDRPPSLRPPPHPRRPPLGPRRTLHHPRSHPRRPRLHPPPRPRSHLRRMTPLTIPCPPTSSHRSAAPS